MLVEYRLPVIDTWKQDNNSIYGDDDSSESIITVDDDDDPGIYEQSNLTEQILDAEKKYSTSSIRTSYFRRRNYFNNQTALYRVLFMGSITEEEKKEIFQKLSQGFIYVLHDRYYNSKIRPHATPIAPFKEIKHNVILLNDEDEPDMISDTYEDSGVSLIEADFTWNSNAMNYAKEPEQLLLRYASSYDTMDKEECFVYPESTPNGVDLCVYFYTGDDHDQVEKDMVLLRALRKLGISVLPLTTTKDELLKAHFADLLTEYKVRCLDLGNLDVGKQPSFFRPSLDRRLEYTSHPRVATYQILAIDQFCAIENRAIFQLLKKTRERGTMEVPEKKTAVSPPPTVAKVPLANTKKEREEETMTAERKTHINTPPSRINHWYFDYRRFLKSLCIMIVFIYCINAFFVQNSKSRWSATFEMDLDYTFTLYTRNTKGELDWTSEDPQVWLNHEKKIPIERVEQKRGVYRLTFDVLSMNIVSFEFTVNTSLPIRYALDIPTTYLIINPSISQENRRKNTQQPRHQERPANFIQNTKDYLLFIGSNSFRSIVGSLIVD